MKKYYLVISTDYGCLRMFESREFNTLDEVIQLWKLFTSNFSFTSDDLKVEICSLEEINGEIDGDEITELTLYSNGVKKI